MGAAVTGFNAAHRRFLAAEARYRAHACGIGELDDALRDLKRNAPPAVSANPALQAVLAEAVNTMRGIRRSIAGPQGADVWPDLVGHVTKAGLAVAGAEKAVSDGDHGVARSRIDTAQRHLAAISRIDRSALPEPCREALDRHVMSIKARIAVARAARGHPPKAAAWASAATPRQAVRGRANPLGAALAWFIGLSLAASGFELASDILGSLWDDAPALFFVLPAIYLLYRARRR